MPTVYSVSHVPPEISAYGMAKYSRSSESMRQSLVELSQQRAEKFLDTFYFAYGHASIADLAHVTLAIEDVSLLAAMDIVDEPVWDGQERSTRYQDFHQSPYYAPESAGALYHELVKELFDAYHRLFEEAFEGLKRRYPQPQSLKKGAYERTLKARAFDISRYLLPLATLTSLGQITSARVLERQISRLMTSRYPEVRLVAQEMKTAATQDEPFNLLWARLERDGLIQDPRLFDQLRTGPVSPTLVKYAEPNRYLIDVANRMVPLIATYCTGMTVETAQPVSLYQPKDLVDHALATLFYGLTVFSYGQLIERLSRVATKEKEDMLDYIFEERRPYDEWLPAFRSAPLVFDVLIDVGAFRDFNRHRRLVKTVQPLSPAMGFDVPEPLADLTIGHWYENTLTRHYEALLNQAEPDQSYLLPLAHRRRVLLAMDPAEAAYIIELRSRSSGHFSYRTMAYRMFEAFNAEFPVLARHIRVTPPDVFDPFER